MFCVRGRLAPRNPSWGVCEQIGGFISHMQQESTIRCTVCSSDDIAPEPFYYDWSEKVWRLHRCSKCTHQFVFPSVGKEEQDRLYDDAYFSAQGKWAGGVFAGGYIEAEDELVKEAQSVVEMLPEIEHGTLLEIGSAGGYFLREAKGAGYDVLGIEPNAEMASYACTLLGLPVINCLVEEVSEHRFENQFDVAVLMDVLAHLPYPKALMKKLDRWLSDTAYLLIRGVVHNQVEILKRKPGEYCARIRCLMVSLWGSTALVSSL